MIKSVSCTRHVACILRGGGVRNDYKILLEKPQQKKKQPGQSRYRWQNIKMILVEQVWQCRLNSTESGQS
jgi:hypothetical protein